MNDDLWDRVREAGSETWKGYELVEQSSSGIGSSSRNSSRSSRSSSACMLFVRKHATLIG